MSAKGRYHERIAGRSLGFMRLTIRREVFWSRYPRDVIHETWTAVSLVDIKGEHNKTHKPGICDK
jgi:hypothetical protein